MILDPIKIQNLANSLNKTT